MDYIWCKFGLMERQTEKITPASIYDWLEKPLTRRPAMNKGYPAEHEAPFEPSGMVNEAGISTLPMLPETKPGAFAKGMNVIAEYAINITPMLQPQMNQPEFFMNNRSKALMAQKGISKISFENFKGRARLDYNQLATLLSVARNTLINKKGEDVFDVTISEKLIALAEVYTHGFEVFGDEDIFIEWLNAPNRALGMVSPFSLLQTQYGRQEVQNILGRIEWGVYS